MLTIHKADHNGKVRITYSGWVLDDEDEIVVLARWQRPPVLLPYVTFAEGDFLVETFFRTRYYNIFALHDGGDLPGGVDIASAVEQIQPRIRQNTTRMLASDRMLASEHLFSLLPRTCPLKGYYINFTYPVDYDAQARVLTWRDLALDLWVPAEGQPLLLDSDEYEALALARRDPELDRAVRSTLAQLWDQAVNRTGPFAPTSAASG